MTVYEVRTELLKTQEDIALWIQAAFDDLSKGIPTSKKIGIYSTSVAWGVLIVTFETVVGGGFTVIDAALDTALAPFLTKGIVEIFAYQQIREIAQELANRYERGIRSVISKQADRYRHCLERLIPEYSTLDALGALDSQLSTMEDE
jgi:hypothetical protein